MRSSYVILRFMITIYHNPRCSKSRQTLQLLQEKGVDANVHLYLENPMPKDILAKAIDVLGESMIRKNEADYKEHIKPLGLEGIELVEAMLKHPKTIERPLVVNGQRLALGRPPESVLEIL